MTPYPFTREEIAELERQIARLEYEQSGVKEIITENKQKLAKLKKELEACYKRLSNYNDIKGILDNFKYKASEIKRKIRKKILKFGIPGIVIAYILGATITNGPIGAILGVSIVTATAISSALLYYNNKMKEDKKIAKKCNIKQVKRKITIEEINKQQNLKKQQKINQDTEKYQRVYQDNKIKLEDLRVKYSIINPTYTRRSTRSYRRTRPLP